MVGLPALREELAVFPGPEALDGAPTWTLHDPVRNSYFQLDWVSFELLKRWRLGNAHSIVESLRGDSTLADIDLADVQAMAQFLLENQLLQSFSASESDRLLAQRQFSERRNWLRWILHHYLFFRVPLFRPDALLDRHAPRFRWLGSRSFWLFSLVALAVGLSQILQQWDVFKASFVDLFSPLGIVAYILTLMLVKSAHELGHAITAKNKGCRVPTMGVAFLVLFPVAYTDVNDVWRLSRKGDRIAVGAAGILTELVIAIWASFFWALLPDGMLRTAFFLLASTTWISTLAVNLMPFLRFDGYFLLMDWAAIPNLHARAFAMGTWWVREGLLKLGAPAPEAFSDRLRVFLIGFALSTWVYRLILFTGIALLVHSLFPAPLGIILGAIEIYWFVLRPVARELGSWPSLLGPSGLKTLLGKGGLLLLAVGFLFLFPWDSRVSGPAAVMPAERFPLVAEEGGRISFFGTESGQAVVAGQRLIELHRPELDYELAALDARIKSIRAQLRGAALQDDRREEGQVLQASLARLEAERDELTANVAEGTITAPFGGLVYWSDLAYEAGSWVARGELLGELVSHQGLRLEALLSQRDVERIGLGDSARFFFESGARASLAFTVTSIDEDAMGELSLPLLSTAAGGSVGVREQQGRLIPEQSVYRVQLESSAEENIEPGVFRGRVVIQGAREAWIGPYADAFLATLRRELTF